MLFQYKGYSRFQKVYSGNVQGKPAGLLPNEEPIAEFSYSQSVLKTLALIEPPYVGFTTVQFRESGAENARILFEQSVQFGIQLIPGGGETGWLLTNPKFKTRICDGQPVPHLTVPQTLPPIAAGEPARPGVPVLYEVGVAVLKIKMPGLPVGAQSFNLLAAVGNSLDKPADNLFQTIASGLPAGRVIDFNVTDLGAVSQNPAVAPTELVWFRLQAVSGNKTTLGPAVNDDWRETNASGQQVRGYEGWRFGVGSILTGNYEDIIAGDFSPFSNTGSSVLASVELQRKAYKCVLPVGAHMVVVNNYWGPAASQKTFYFSISYKTGVALGKAIRDPRVGQSWFFYILNGEVRCKSILGDEDIIGVPCDAIVHDGAVEDIFPARSGAKLHVLLDAADGIMIYTSYDEGVTWQVTYNYAQNIKVLAAQLSHEGGAYFIYGQATGTIVVSDQFSPRREIKEGEIVRLVFQFNGSSWDLSEVGPVLDGDGKTLDAPKTDIVGMSINGVTVHLMQNSNNQVQLYRSTDELRTLQPVPNLKGQEAV